MDHVERILEQWRQERPDIDVAPMDLVARVMRLSQILTQEMGKTWAAHGLTFASFDVLATLRRSGPPYRLSPGELMAMTLVTSGTMTNRIDQLEKIGLVERLPNPADGRGFLIALTEKGFAVIDTAVTDHVQTQKELVSGLSAGKLADLTKRLTAFLEDFEKH